MRAPELSVLETVGVQTVLAVDLDDDYQGSVAAILRKESWRDELDENDLLGLLIIGYGSCSGCDEWEALEYNHLGKLEHCASLLRGVRWLDNLAELKAFVAGTPETDEASDHALQWYGHSTYFPQFQQHVADLQPGHRIQPWEDD